MIALLAWFVIVILCFWGLLLFCRDEVYDLGWGDEAGPLAGYGTHRLEARGAAPPEPGGRVIPADLKAYVVTGKPARVEGPVTVVAIREATEDYSAQALTWGPDGFVWWDLHRLRPSLDSAEEVRDRWNAPGGDE
ncbi:MAG TPA: hypothetical protein PK308_00220 [Phycisphaerales bacterium]|nr:hypothetical protein [Phycisphaerales bacterium]